MNQGEVQRWPPQRYQRRFYRDRPMIRGTQDLDSGYLLQVLWETLGLFPAHILELRVQVRNS